MRRIGLLGGCLAAWLLVAGCPGGGGSDGEDSGDGGRVPSPSEVSYVEAVSPAADALDVALDAGLSVTFTGAGYGNRGVQLDLVEFDPAYDCVFLDEGISCDGGAPAAVAQDPEGRFRFWDTGPLQGAGAVLTWFPSSHPAPYQLQPNKGYLAHIWSDDDSVKFAWSFHTRAITGVVSGQVLDSRGDPVAGAQVQSADGSATATTDASGWFQLPLPVGTQTLAVSLGGTTLTQVSASVSDGQPTELGSVSPSQDVYLWYHDGDGDGYGDGSPLLAAVSPGETYAVARDLRAVAGDCDDGNAAVHPGAADAVGDGLDADCDGRDDPATTVFTARIGAARDTGVPGTTFQLQGGSAAGAVAPIIWQWDLGDGRVADGQSVEVSYPAPGIYPVRLQATDAGGAQGEAGILLTVFDVEDTVPTFMGIPLGDLDGDGALGSTDTAMLVAHLDGTARIADSLLLLSADLDLDGAVTAADLDILSEAAQSGDKWARRLLPPEGTPGANLLLLSPALLDPAGVATVRFGSREPVSLFRPTLGYGRAIVPIDPEWTDLSAVSPEDLTVELLIDGQVADRFAFRLVPTPVLEGAPGEVLQVAVAQVVEQLTAVRATLADALAVGGTEEQTAELANLLDRLLAQAAVRARTGFAGVRAGLDEQSLRAVEQFLLSRGLGVAEPRVPRAAMADVACTRPPGLFVAEKMLRLREALGLFEGGSSALTEAAFALGAFAAVSPADAPFAAAFMAEAMPIAASLELLEIIRDFLPTLEPVLKVEVAPMVLGPGQVAAVDVYGQLDGPLAACQGGAALLQKKVKEIVLKRVMKFTGGANHIGAFAAKFPLGKASEWADVVTGWFGETLSEYTEWALGPLSGILSGALDALTDKVCSYASNPELGRFQIPPWALYEYRLTSDTLPDPGTLLPDPRSSACEVATGTYQAPVTAESGKATIKVKYQSTSWDVAFGSQSITVQGLGWHYSGIIDEATGMQVVVSVASPDGQNFSIGVNWGGSYRLAYSGSATVHWPSGTGDVEVATYNWYNPPNNEGRYEFMTQCLEQPCAQYSDQCSPCYPENPNNCNPTVSFSFEPQYPVHLQFDGSRTIQAVVTLKSVNVQAPACVQFPDEFFMQVFSGVLELQE